MQLTWGLLKTIIEYADSDRNKIWLFRGYS